MSGPSRPFYSNVQHTMMSEGFNSKMYLLCSPVIFLFHWQSNNISSFFSLQFVHLNVSTEPVHPIKSAVTSSVWAAALCPGTPPNAWPAATSCTVRRAWIAAHRDTTPSRAGAACPLNSARTCTTSVRTRAETVTRTSSTTGPASQNARPDTPPSTPPRTYQFTPQQISKCRSCSS